MVWGGLLLYQTCAVLGIINVEYSIPFCHTGPEKWNKRLKSCVSVEGLNMRKWCLKISCFVWSFKNLEIIQQKEKTTNLHVWGTGNSKRLAFLLRYASVPFIQTDEVQQANIERAVWKMLMCVNNVSVLSSCLCLSVLFSQATSRHPNGIKSLRPALQTSLTLPCASVSAAHSSTDSRRRWKPSSSTGSRAVR